MSARVAVYIDFDNMVISRYDAVHGSGRWRRDEARRHAPGDGSDGDVSRRLADAEVDLGAIIDYASSFGTVALTRAYADWSVPANAAYQRQLTDRAVDLVQLFATSGTKNGADIRLSIDAIDDLFQHADITHVVVVGGDSDYIALAQRCKRMGRYVVGIGVAGSTSRALVAACDDFSSYGDLPGVTEAAEVADEAPHEEPAPASDARSTTKAPAKKAAKVKTAPARKSSTSKAAQATALLRRAVAVGAEKSDDGWQHSSSVKSQMQRLDSTFKEKSLGFSSFRAFVEDHDDLLETRLLDNGQLAVRLR
ncbi:NYN domain-containing protein [Luteipulveratus sp. YIM 133132]|uniref:NYN domain-containing protein n=1 Tax=Luteipulveratus flavus TaxID=3031728 RepID=UPI0023B070DC|nr:NYN domain-containing protein [Luteipulveratus sp. YIM 133132]MDE9364711.1 NYN domain-containing protein [Luteipulveratus sp. YIM 133132]